MPQSRLHGRIPECTARQTLNRNTKKGYRNSFRVFRYPSAFVPANERRRMPPGNLLFPVPRFRPGISRNRETPPDGGSENFYRWTIPPNTPSLPVAATPGRILHKTRFLSCLHARQSTLYRATPAGESGFFTVLAGKRFSFSGNVITLCSHPMVTESLRKSRSPFPGISAMDSDPFQSSSPSNTNAADPVMSTRSAV